MFTIPFIVLSAKSEILPGKSEISPHVVLLLHILPYSGLLSPSSVSHPSIHSHGLLILSRLTLVFSPQSSPVAS